MRANKTKLRETARFLRQVVPGDALSLACSDDAERTLTIDSRMDLDNDGVVLKASGHGTHYQINVARPSIDAPVSQIQWQSGRAIVTEATLRERTDQLWSDTTAADIGVSER